MGKGKLAKFADMARYPNVVEAPLFDNGEAFPLRGRWNSDFFKREGSIVLELGCGRGEYAVGLGRLFPEKNFIGVDIKGARMWSGATEALNEGLANVGFLRTRIEFIDRFFAANEVSEIWLTFSDPQMRKPTKRLTSTYFLERYRRFLIPGGQIHVKTDSNFLYTYTGHVVSANRLPLQASTDNLYASAQLDEDTRRLLAIRTYYESQWMERGISIKYLRFTLPHETQLREPDVEIPLDDYRSYSRTKRSSLTHAK